MNSFDGYWSEDLPLSQFDGLTVEDTEALLGSLNSSSSDDIRCKLQDMTSTRVKTPGGCNSSFDGLMCWHSTAPNTMAVLPCMPVLNGIAYNTSRKYILISYNFNYLKF